MITDYDKKDIVIAYRTAIARNFRSIDPMTKIYNKAHFNKRSKEEINRSERYGHNLSLLMIDIDRFKQYNDRNGHPAGDKVLKNIANILKEKTRKLIDIVARYGGEEFAAILPETPIKSKDRILST